MRVVSLSPTPTVPPVDAAALPREMRFEVLSTGDSPRVQLRYRAAGVAREVVSRAAVTTRQYAGGAWSDPLTLAPLHDGFGITPGTAGVVHVRGLVAHVDESGASVSSVAAANAYLARWRALLEGARADVTIDDRGRFRSASIIGATSGSEIDAREELVQRWLALAVPLPDEPIGIGARWRVVTALRAGGTVLKQDATYMLTAFGESEWTLDVTIERLGEPQDIFVPGAAGDDSPVIGELVGLRRIVTGSIVVGDGDPLPLRGMLHADVTSHARLRVGAKIDEQVSEDEATIVIESAPPLPVP